MDWAQYIRTPRISPLSRIGPTTLIVLSYRTLGHVSDFNAAYKAVESSLLTFCPAFSKNTRQPRPVSTKRPKCKEKAAGHTLPPGSLIMLVLQLLLQLVLFVAFLCLYGLPPWKGRIRRAQSRSRPGWTPKELRRLLWPSRRGIAPLGWARRTPLSINARTLSLFEQCLESQTINCTA